MISLLGLTYHKGYIMKLIASFLEKACNFCPDYFQYSFSSESCVGFIHRRLAKLLFHCWCYTFDSQRFFWRVDTQGWYEDQDGKSILFIASANTPACAVNDPFFEWD